MDVGEVLKSVGAATGFIAFLITVRGVVLDRPRLQVDLESYSAAAGGAPLDAADARYVPEPPDPDRAGDLDGIVTNARPSDGLKVIADTGEDLPRLQISIENLGRQATPVSAVGIGWSIGRQEIPGMTPGTKQEIVLSHPDYSRTLAPGSRIIFKYGVRHPPVHADVPIRAWVEYGGGRTAWSPPDVHLRYIEMQLPSEVLMATTSSIPLASRSKRLPSSHDGRSGSRAIREPWSTLEGDS